MPVTLRFQETQRYAYPVTTAGNGTALTIARVSGDPYLAFLTQTGFDDEVVFLATGFDYEYFRFPNPTGRDVITGMAFDEQSGKIICCNETVHATEVFAFDPVTRLETSMQDLAADTALTAPHGIAVKPNLYLRASDGTLEMRARNGTLLGTRSYPGREIRGIAASPWSWTFVDRIANEIVVIGPLGNEIATAPAPGGTSGVDDIAYDMLADMANEPQVWLEPGVVGNPGTIHHPDTPWSPEPWLGRHRLYIANTTDQIIYAGYLTAEP
ncbi:MAG: hypothetical protein MUE52_11270 [Tabrizicola sp.]|jgi:hypothetical protein|nr:hypothetical protein [Tabrizicola sp.]